ncbi:MAG: hypothetical protein K8R36_18370, partial [Planctomycetales bacterium]|nr:hypothetical protein [Planctomycetales bacterium]
IKNNPATRHLPVIMLSGKGFELKERDIQERYGIRSLIGKPFSPRELFQQVETLLAGGEAAPARCPALQWL